MVEVVTIETPGLGDRSYIAHDGRTAVVIDPQRDIDRLLEVVGGAGLAVSHVFETHLHNDYVTGGLALARATGAAYVTPAGDDVAFERVAVSGGDTFDAGDLTVTAIHTPGHTPNHTSYVLADGGRPVAVFTGGSMLFGAVGRTDLLGPDQADALTRAQYRSVRRLAMELSGEVTVHPTHGFGSFCSATETTGDTSTIGRQLRDNIAMQVGDEDRFVERLLGGLGAYPSYYAHMAPLNAAGPAAPDLSLPAEVDAGGLRRALEGPGWVVDLRDRRAFARLHVTGTVSVELGEPFATYFGWTLPWGAPVTLLAESAEDLLAARRQLSRIGIDGLSGAAGRIEDLAGSHRSTYEVAGFADLARVVGSPRVVVLDVRRPDEWAEAHIEGAEHIPIWELADRVTEVPAGHVWVHCASGFRASIGASILDRAGREVTLVDDEWGRAAGAGVPVVAG